MTIADINNLFDILYNNALSGKAPGLDLFDKSWFCTLSYRELVKEFAINVDSSEKRREELRVLINNGVVDYDGTLNTSFSDHLINISSKVFELPEDVWYILQETIKNDTTTIKVAPILLDEYNEQINNPFQKPNANKAWRLDLADIGAGTKHIVEIITTIVPTKYQFRYLKKPDAIILGDLTLIDDDLSIEGNTAASLPNISSEIHETIVKRAVLLAVEAYKENNLQSKMSITNKDV